MTGALLDLDIFKDIPGYKGILKAVLKYQIQLLVEQLSEHGGEESVLLSANLSEGTLSHLGSEAGKGFLTDHNDVKRQYLGYCLKMHQKRKSEFMSPPSTHDDLEPSKLIRSNPESVVNFPVHKKPYFRVQRRNTRIRSGGKQFSSFYPKSAYSRPTGQRVASEGSYLRADSQGSGYSIRRLESQRTTETLRSQIEGQRSNEQKQSSKVTVKTEIAAEDKSSNREHRTSLNEGEVIVKVEPPDDMDEREDRVSTIASEDIQTFGDRMGHQFSSNASMETEDSFSEGNQSFEYVLDRENSQDIITPWKPDEMEKQSQFTSKRKQALPTRITKTAEPEGKNKISPSLFGQLSKKYGTDLTNQRPGSSEWFSNSEPTAYSDSNHGRNSKRQSFGNLTDMENSRQEGVQVSSWTQEQMLNVSPETSFRKIAPAPYVENTGSGAEIPNVGNSSWMEEGYMSPGFKQYMKTPQIDGLFVSRGEGRYEKLIKCEECGKVCRTSNMARHKKRYCTTLPKVGRTRKNYPQTVEYSSMNEMPYDVSRSNVYMDNPENEEDSIDLTDSPKEAYAAVTDLSTSENSILSKNQSTEGLGGGYKGTSGNSRQLRSGQFTKELKNTGNTDLDQSKDITTIETNEKTSLETEFHENENMFERSEGGDNTEDDLERANTARNNDLETSVDKKERNETVVNVKQEPKNFDT